MITRCFGMSLFLTVLPGLTSAQEREESLQPSFDIEANTVRGRLNKTPISRFEIRPRARLLHSGFLEFFIATPVGSTNFRYRKEAMLYTVSSELTTFADISLGGGARLTFRSARPWILRAGLGAEVLVFDGNPEPSRVRFSYGDFEFSGLGRFRNHVSLDLHWTRVAGWFDAGRRFRWFEPSLGFGLEAILFSLRLHPDKYLRPMMSLATVGEDDLRTDRHGIAFFTRAAARIHCSRALAVDIGGSAALPINAVLFTAFLGVAYAP